MITGFEIKNIEARRFIPVGSQKNIRIDHNSTVGNITRTGDDKATVEFRFSANYASAGIITLEGQLIYVGDAEALVAEWGEKRKMPDDAAREIHSAIMGNCLTEAVVLSRDIRLPPPIPFPQVNLPGSTGKKEYTPGPEVM